MSADDDALKPAAPSRGNLMAPLRAALAELARGISHEGVVGHVREEGRLSGRYIFMIVMSCAIATLGLLQSSPAVIIGAMLVSPLMGPIMQMGFSLAIIELSSLRQSLLSLAAGTACALAVSFLIVTLSPISEETPEILARTRPNLFDLLVALFSGLAGGYAVIHRKGETIVGVAIATALMPPLAVTGYGLAVGAMSVAGGAFFLFMTNLLAIALSVAVLSRLYGFGAEHSPRHTLMQTGLVFVVFLGLSVPLGIALRDISTETQVKTVARVALLEPFAQVQARMTDLSFSFPKDAPVRITATVFTRERVEDADAQLSQTLSTRLRRPVEVRLDQLLVDQREALEDQRLARLTEAAMAGPLRAEFSRLEAMAEDRRTAQMLRAAAPFPLVAADLDPASGRAVLVAAPDTALTLSALRVVEAGMAQNFPQWTLSVRPPVQGLPPVSFAAGEAEPDAAGAAALADSVWALQRWGVSRVEVAVAVSAADMARRGGLTGLAARRAEAVSKALAAAGLSPVVVAEMREGENSAAGDVRLRPAAGD